MLGLPYLRNGGRLDTRVRIYERRRCDRAGIQPFGHDHSGAIQPSSGSRDRPHHWSQHLCAHGVCSHSTRATSAFSCTASRGVGKGARQGESNSQHGASEHRAVAVHRDHAIRWPPVERPEFMPGWHCPDCHSSRIATDARRPRAIGGDPRLLIFHLSFAIGELVANFAPIWPMGNGLVDFAYRPNFLFPSLPGRPMTSFAHPIPLATFALVSGLLSCHVAIQTRRLRYSLLLVASAILIALSGTRSAVIALTAGLIVLLLSSRWTGAVTEVNLLGLAILASMTLFVYPSAVLGLIGLGEGFTESNSFRYRISILGSATRILDQTPVHVLFGWGGDREEVFRRGIVDGAGYGVLFFDNQFVATAALFGLFGFGLLMIIFLLIGIRGSSLSRAIAASYVMMGFGFDFLQYLPPALLFYLAVALADIDRKDPRIDRDLDDVPVVNPRELHVVRPRSSGRR